MALSGAIPTLWFLNSNTGDLNGTTNATQNFTALIGQSNIAGSYAAGAGDLNIITQSGQAGNSNAINFSTPINDTGNYSIRMTVAKSGNVGIGTTTPAYKLHVMGDINTSSCFRIGATTVSGTCTSDARLKENIQDYSGGLNDLLGIRLRTYQFNGLGEMPKTGETAVGVIAQEVEHTNPELVKTRKVKMHTDDQELTDIKVVDYSKFTYMLINAVKELYFKITGIEEEQSSQERRIASIEDSKVDKAAFEAMKTDQSAVELKIKRLAAENAEIKNENAQLKTKDQVNERKIRELEQRLERLERFQFKK